MLDVIKKNLKEKPLSTMAAILGVITGFAGVLALGSTGVDNMREYIVSKDDLEAAKVEVIEAIHKEAVVTRNVIAGEIEVRKGNLLHDLEHTTDAGKIATIIEEIKVLNKRLDKILDIDK